MKKRTWLIASIAVLALIFGTGFFIPHSDFGIGHFFKALVRAPSLEQENLTLKQTVFDLQNIINALEQGIALPAGGAYLPAKVFALYPFNVKSRVYITVGDDHHVRVGQAVVISKTTLVGVVARTRSDQSEVVTLYDPTFSLPVKIGKDEVNGLLYGGVSPRVGLIDKTKHIGAGDRIVSASKDLPYGLVVGSVGAVSEDAAGAFFEATVDVPYVLKDLTTVFIISSK